MSIHSARSSLFDQALTRAAASSVVPGSWRITAFSHCSSRARRASMSGCMRASVRGPPFGGEITWLKLPDSARTCATEGTLTIASDAASHRASGTVERATVAINSSVGTTTPYALKAGPRSETGGAHRRAAGRRFLPAPVVSSTRDRCAPIRLLAVRTPAGVREELPRRSPRRRASSLRASRGDWAVGVQCGRVRTQRAVIAVAECLLGRRRNSSPSYA